MKQKKSSSPGLILLGIILFFGFLSSEALDSEVAIGIIGLIILAAPVVVLVLIVRAIAKRGQTNVHTHDRIDHREDLKVNPKTGKTSQPTRRMVPHSPQEHWKQQLDGLLANGTIDRSEYKALMKRRF